MEGGNKMKNASTSPDTSINNQLKDTQFFFREGGT